MIHSLAISGSIVKHFTFLENAPYEWVAQFQPLLKLLRFIYDKISGQLVFDKRIEFTNSVNAELGDIAFDNKKVDICPSFYLALS